MLYYLDTSSESMSRLLKKYALKHKPKRATTATSEYKKKVANPRFRTLLYGTAFDLMDKSGAAVA